jgi:PKD repeat protein
VNEQPKWLRWLVLALVLAGVVGLLIAKDDESDEGSPVRAQFSATFDQPATGPTSCPVVAVRFTDRSSGEPTSWKWTFGDGTTSTDQNPTWEPGAVTAEVTLTVSRGEAEDSITKRITTHEC